MAIELCFYRAAEVTDTFLGRTRRRSKMTVHVVSQIGLTGVTQDHYHKFNPGETPTSPPVEASLMDPVLRGHTHDIVGGVVQTAAGHIHGVVKDELTSLWEFRNRARAFYFGFLRERSEVIDVADADPQIVIMSPRFPTNAAVATWLDAANDLDVPVVRQLGIDVSDGATRRDAVRLFLEHFDVTQRAADRTRNSLPELFTLDLDANPVLTALQIAEIESALGVTVPPGTTVKAAIRFLRERRFWNLSHVFPFPL